MKIQQDLLATYRDGFHKYGGEIDARATDKNNAFIVQSMNSLEINLFTPGLIRFPKDGTGEKSLGDFDPRQRYVQKFGTPPVMVCPWARNQIKNFLKP